MKNLIINRGNILKHDLNLKYKSAIILSAIDYLFQKKKFSEADCITDETGVWYGVSHSDIIKEVPILKASKNTSMNYINVLIDLGFIERHFNCERLSRTYLKPSKNYMLYFENDTDKIILDQDNLFCYDRRLNLLHWIVLQKINKIGKRAFYTNFIFIDEKEVLNSLTGIINYRDRYIKILNDLIRFGYIKRSDWCLIKKLYYYKAGAQFLGYKQLGDK